MKRNWTELLWNALHAALKFLKFFLDRSFFDSQEEKSMNCVWLRLFLHRHSKPAMTPLLVFSKVGRQC